MLLRLGFTTAALREKGLKAGLSYRKERKERTDHFKSQI